MAITQYKVLHVISFHENIIHRTWCLTSFEYFSVTNVAKVTVRETLEIINLIKYATLSNCGRFEGWSKVDIRFVSYILRRERQANMYDIMARGGFIKNRIWGEGDSCARRGKQEARTSGKSFQANWCRRLSRRLIIHCHISRFICKFCSRSRQ